MTSFVGSADGVDSVTLPAHSADDLILIFAFNQGSTTPALASGYTEIDSESSNNTSFRLGYKIAASGSETSGTWTNATSTLAHVYRSASGSLSIGSTPSKTSNGFSSDVEYSALTMDVTDGSSWVVGFAGHSSNNVSINTAPTGMTNRSFADDVNDRAAGHDTNGGVASWSLQTVAVGGSSSAYRSSVVEIVETASGLTIDSTDASMQREADWSLTASNPSTVPTLLNSDLTNDTTVLTPTSVTGSDPYTLTFPVGDMDKQVDATGYPWTLDINAETVVTANIPLTIQAGYTLVDLVSPDTTSASLLFGADRDAPVTGDHLEYTVTSTLDDTIELNVAASGVWTITNVDNWVTDITVSRRVVQVDGSIGTEAVVTLSAATGLTTLVGSLVQDAVSGIISNMVN